jgi:arginine utilization protein RocB
VPVFVHLNPSARRCQAALWNLCVAHKFADILFFPCGLYPEDKLKNHKEERIMLNENVKKLLKENM